MPMPNLMPFLLGDDTLPPSISNANPTSGSTLAASDSVVEFDVTDAVGGVSYIAVLLEFVDRPAVIVGEGDPSVAMNTLSPYACAADPITNGYRVTVYPGPEGWGQNPAFRVQAIDSYGNRRDFDDAGAPSYSFTPVIDPGDVDPPEISNVSPEPGTAIRKNQAISFDMLGYDVALYFIVAQYPDGVWELVHDGTTFAPMYTNPVTTKEATEGGVRFTVLRNGGWHKPPTFVVKASDNSGNVTED